ncbi:unnamed protein product [Adineta steineri]|uniref:SAM domain-containing protein n=1 Tax=Adineta steineri TaxID=433720 RepID=A0A815MHY3_9BILA|nr:unnamed protein product [Adineta steineri]CAF3895763.1 unnamed protein product [Adineta steineri]
MTDRLTSDMSFWLKFVRDSNLTVNNSTILKYSMALADRFSTIEEFLTANENDLNKLGIIDQADRSRLIKQARLLDDKANQPFEFKRRSAVANRVIESWIGDGQAKPLNSNTLSKSTCNLSPALLSRISFNDRPTSVIYPYAEPVNDIRKRNFGHLNDSNEKILTVDDNGKIQTTLSSSSLEYQGVFKKPPSTSIHGMRTIKSLSDTISLQKKVSLGNDQLKRLDSTTSLFQRQTSLIGKKMTNLATKLVNPFVTIKKKIEPISTVVDSQIDLRTNMKRQVSLMDNNNVTITPRRTVMISPLKRTREDDDDDDEDNEPNVTRKVQMLNVNQQIQRPTGLFSYKDVEELKPNVAPVQTLGSKRFKLGATTSFLTRSLANHGLIE